MPIFIVGFPRSGTTLAQKLVSQQLGIPTLPETHYFEFLVEHEPAGGQLKPEAARALVDQLGAFLKIDAQALRGLLSRDEIPIRALFLQLIGQQIGSQALADKGQWLEKTPGHAEHLERIHLMFPKARFLCMVRNPLQAFASRRELLESGKGWGEEWKPIEAYCVLWAEHVQTVRAFSERHPGQMLILRLEDLAADPDSQMKRVREYVGPGFAKPTEAPLEPGIIQPFETWKRDALKPADPSIADRTGKILLDPWETWRVKTLLRDEMTLLGYPTDAIEPAPLDDLHRRLVSSIDWYREQWARRDALMDVKTTRIRGLLNELAEREPAAPAPSATAASPRPDGTPGPAPSPAAAPNPPSASGKKTNRAAKRGSAKVGAKRARAPVPVPVLAASPAASPKPRHKPPADDDDSFPPPRPILLRGISGVNDNAAEFAAKIAQVKGKGPAPAPPRDDEE